MANCCNYSPCEGLNTIQFMKDLVNATQVKNCVTIRPGTTAATCCDGTDIESNYIPRYSQLTGGTFAPVRSTNNANPNLDKNGFTYEVPTVIDGCCTGDTQANEALMKSQVGFEYTIPAGNRCDITSQPSDYCNPTFTVTETQTYTRHRFICNGTDGGVVETTQPSVSPKTVLHQGTLTKNYNYDGNQSWTVTYDDYRVTGETIVNDNSSCVPSITSETTVTFGGYSFSFTFDCPNSVPCDGDDYTITVNGTKCNNDLSLEIICIDIEGYSTPIEWHHGDENVTISIPRNEGGKTSGTIRIIPTVNGDTDSSWEINCPFDRQLCEWSPSHSNDGECGPFLTAWVWDEPNEHEHGCS